MRTTRSPFAHIGHEKLIALCKEELPGLPGIEVLAFYDCGFHVFTIAESDDEERQALERAFRQLITEFVRFDGLVRDFGTGELMRVVVQSDAAAVHCGHVFEEEYLIGMTRDLALVEEMDEAVSHLVTRIRKEIYLQADQLPGGRRGPRETPGLESAVLKTVAGEATDSDLVTDLLTFLGATVDVNDLHYVAVYREWRFICSADVIDSPALAPWFGGAEGTEGARKLYQDFATRLRSDLPELAYSLRQLSEEPIRRLVLDVVSGAIYAYPLPNSRGFAVGVTVFQPEVFVAENRLREGIDRIADLLGAG
ncbi:hypothetical protein [Nonomuraea insulae]|uniref:Roadblock/LAMTOR2 domain-containing protein n=1 Tax=Nonomuraea insulae TaxID=1616787 RepID=A0ABW1D7I3_9ACTN